jgi:hypothetical protein
VVSRHWDERYIGQISLEVCDTHGLCSRNRNSVNVYASELNLSIQASDITFTPDCNVAAQDRVINAKVRLATLNNAATNLPETRVDFYGGNPNVGGTLIGQQIIPAGSRDPGEIDVNQPWTVNDPDVARDVYVIVDPQDMVWEFNESDNLADTSACNDDPTPTLLSLVSAEVTADGIKLAWLTSGSGSAVATVYRSPVGGAWARIGQVTTDGTGYLRYTDHPDVTITRMGYRLGMVDAGVESFYGETWVDVPVSLAFALDPVRPNPALGGALTVHFSLPTNAPARLELLDVAGRCIASHNIGAGQRTLDLREGQHLAPGLYLVRLTQGTNTRVTRVVVFR